MVPSPITCTRSLSRTPRDNYCVFSTLLLNARSLCNKMEMLRVYARDYNHLMICTSEYWCNSEIDDVVLKLVNFSMYRCDRITYVGGGVLIYVSLSIHPSLFQISPLMELKPLPVKCFSLQIPVSPH